MQIQARKFGRTRVEVSDLGIGAATLGSYFADVDRGDESCQRTLA